MHSYHQQYDDGEFDSIRISSKEIQKEKEKARNKELWNLKNAGVYRAWNIIRGELLSQGVDEETAEKISRGSGANIVIINSGIDYNHPDITDRFTSVKGYNFVDEDSNPSDEKGHGTNIAGIVAGELTGVANQSTIYSLKIGRKTDFTYKRLNKAIKWCIENKKKFDIDIINLSLSGTEYEPLLEDRCREAYDNGMLIVASAGNKWSGATFPSAFDKVVSVGAVDENGKHCEFSNVWPMIDISAPGNHVFTIGKKGKSYINSYEKTKGTSVATPLVVGIFALVVAYLKHKRIEYKPDDLKQCFCAEHFRY